MAVALRFLIGQDEYKARLGGVSVRSKTGLADYLVGISSLAAICLQ